MFRPAGPDDLDRIEEIYERIHTEVEAGTVPCVFNGIRGLELVGLEKALNTEEG